MAYRPAGRWSASAEQRDVGTSANPPDRRTLGISRSQMPSRKRLIPNSSTPHDQHRSASPSFSQTHSRASLFEPPANALYILLEPLNPPHFRRKIQRCQERHLQVFKLMAHFGYLEMVFTDMLVPESRRPTRQSDHLLRFDFAVHIHICCLSVHFFSSIRSFSCYTRHICRTTTSGVRTIALTLWTALATVVHQSLTLTYGNILATAPLSFDVSLSSLPFPIRVSSNPTPSLSWILPHPL
jgi:hypothetical protein